MPCLRIETNEQLDPKKKLEVLEEASRVVADQLEKPESYVMVVVEAAKTMSFGGNAQPLALLHLDSIGFAKSPAELSKVLCGFVQQHLGVAIDRVYIKFDDVSRDMYGWNGKTFG